MPIRKIIKVVSLVVALAAAQTISAAPASGDASRLGKDLTPLGGERAANQDGSIPAWVGTEGPTQGWAAGKSRTEHFKHKDDKPLYTIDASNVDKFVDKLSPGQVQLIKQWAGYKMVVYPSRRTCGSPNFVEENTRKNIGAATIGANGWSLKEAIVPGIPFPFPRDGTEAMWNSKMRYVGIGLDMPRYYTTITSRPGGGEWIISDSTQSYFYPWGAKGSAKLSELPPVESFTFFAYKSPPALAGQSAVITIYLDKANEVQYYFPGQRRVRRLPTYAYDSPQIGTENQYTVDEPRMFNGTIDRFDWKLVGKKELIVGYNAFGMYDPTAKYREVVTENGIASAIRRYELHRVHVVEATLKQGVRHVAPKRTFYIDEDSWAILLAEDYDAQGKLWKVREAYPIPVYETGSCDNAAFVQYNMIDKRFVLDQTPLGAGVDLRWIVESSEPKFKESFYNADNLRAISER